MKSIRMIAIFLFLAVVVIAAGACSCENDEDEAPSSDSGGSDDDNNVMDDDDDEPAEKPTHPLLEITTGDVRVPFPSLYFTRSDSHAPTGSRLTLEKKLPETVRLVLDVSDRTDLSLAMPELDGFSIIAPILIPFSGALDVTPWTADAPGDLHKPGQKFARLFDITEQSPTPLGLWSSFVEGRNVLVLQPHKPLPPGHRILVCIRGPLTDVVGEPVTRPGLFDAVMKGETDLPDDPLVDDLLEMRDLIESGVVGVAPDDVLLAFSYWTGSGQTVLHAIRKVIDDLDGDTPIVPENVSYEDAQTVAGSYLSPEFRVDNNIPAADAGVIPEIREMVRLNFIIRLPSQIKAPLPPVIYLHGTGGWRYSAPTMEGMAVFAIEAVLHGDRDDYTGDAPYPFLDLEKLRVFRDNIRQTVADHVAFARVIRHLVADPVAYGLPAGLLTENTIGVVGHSLGCLNGGAFSSIDPAVDHLACVGGGGMFSLFQGKSVYGLFMPAGIRGLPPYEGLIFQHMMQAVIDTADAAALSPGLVLQPPDGRPPRNVLILEAVGDRSVPNKSTEAIAWGAGLGLNVGAPSNWFELEPVSLPLTGNLGDGAATGLLFEYAFNVPPTDQHGELFDSPLQLEQVHTFLLTASETGVATIIDPGVKK